jgi:hypothetical protein
VTQPTTAPTNRSSPSSSPAKADDDLEELAKVIDKAANGDASTIPVIREAIKKNLGIIDAFGGNLAQTALDSFIKALSEKNVLFRECLNAKLTTMRGELAGPTPSCLEWLLVERVVACWLQVQDADIRYAQAGNLSLAQAEYFQRRMNHAHKRYMSAVKTLAVVRKLAVPAVQINIARKQVNQLNTGNVTEANRPEPGTVPANDRGSGRPSQVASPP